jgi:hypothetical protein
MNDDELAGVWTALEPTPHQRRRIEARVRGWLDARQTSLAAEWLGLLKVSPLAGLGFAAMAACLVLIATPLSWLTSAML